MLCRSSLPTRSPWALFLPPSFSSSSLCCSVSWQSLPRSRSSRVRPSRFHRGPPCSLGITIRAHCPPSSHDTVGTDRFCTGLVVGHEGRPLLVACHGFSLSCGCVVVCPAAN